jgi:glycosyltransferase involved in cell wall biosynthesis
MLGVHRLAGTWKNLIHVYVALTEFGRLKLIEAGLPAEKIVVKPNCLPNDPGERAGRGDYALFAGRLSDEKGIGTLIRAWERLDGIPLTIVGDGPLRQLVQSSVLRLRRASIRFMGFQQRDVVLEMMRSARFLVFPSECYEGFPLTLLEAFASGLPVIGAAHGAVEEIIMRDAAGLLFTPGDDQALASTVQLAWDSPDRTTELGRRARKAYEGRYTGAKNRGQLLEIYAKAMAARDAERVHH